MPMPGARPNVGPVTTPQPGAGNIHAASEKVKTAVKLLEEALPLIPMGMPLHTEIMQATTKLVKHLSDSAQSPGTELQTLLNMARQSAQSQPMMALSRMMGAGYGSGAGGAPAAPAIPPPGAGAGEPPMPMTA